MGEIPLETMIIAIIKNNRSKLFMMYDSTVIFISLQLVNNIYVYLCFRKILCSVYALLFYLANDTGIVIFPVDVAHVSHNPRLPSPHGRFQPLVHAVRVAFSRKTLVSTTVRPQSDVFFALSLNLCRCNLWNCYCNLTTCKRDVRCLHMLMSRVSTRFFCLIIIN